jgi:2,3-bisphosphoglycerate-dependent phosphoglycerate mutase
VTRPPAQPNAVLPDSAAVPETYHQRPFALPPGATEVILVRHGASAPAVPGQPFPLLDGHGDPPLAPEGEAQAERVAERLAGEPLRMLFVTALSRTHRTAAPLAQRTGLQPVVVPDLNEVMLGEWEGGEFRIRMAQGDPVAVQAVAEERWEVIPGAETMVSLATRVRAGVESIVELAGPDAHVAAVVHGGVIGEVCRQATGSRPFAFVHADNASLTRVIALQNGTWLLRSFNDTAHLA